MAPSDEVNTAIGEAPDLDEEIAKLEKELAVPTPRQTQEDRLAELKARKAKREAAVLRAEAERRVVGIRRAYAGLSKQLDLDCHEVAEAAGAYAKTVDRMNARFLQLGQLRAEHDGLTAGFGLELKALAPVAILATRKEWQEACETVARTGVPDTNRSRVEDVPASEGYALLVRAGKIEGA